MPALRKLHCAVLGAPQQPGVGARGGGSVEIERGPMGRMACSMQKWGSRCITRNTAYNTAVPPWHTAPYINNIIWLPLSLPLRSHQWHTVWHFCFELPHGDRSGSKPVVHALSSKIEHLVRRYRFTRHSKAQSRQLLHVKLLMYYTRRSD